MTAFRQPRGGKSEQSGDEEQRGRSSGTAPKPFEQTGDRVTRRSFDQPFRDPLTLARAQSAYDEIWSRLQTAIDEMAVNPSLSSEARAAALRVLRERQRIDAQAARRRVMAEEGAAARQRGKQRHDRSKLKPR